MRPPHPSWLVPPGLLVVVALVQIGLAHRVDLSPWLGGGFGMFATIDSRSERHLVVIEESPGLRREMPVPEILEEVAERVRALPTEPRMQALAEGIASARKQRIPGLERVRLQLWWTHRDPGTLAPRDRLAREVVVEVGREADG